ncbi:hypothetical protein [Corynebacterium yonathiae]|uniref:Uncharacterized protein n=1 Tax=Corynebacterium yonathiae TaxID=2913504 RepID=A0A9X3LXU2_9CORY|nr:MULTISPECIES: hypothetical protein [Corynebacterium]MCZ9296085.1 hypothetical protein [Corynebacterium yonathiae]MDK2583281.1 hypothetical protein [Corynebacterium sp. BWA136]
MAEEYNERARQERAELRANPREGLWDPEAKRSAQSSTPTTTPGTHPVRRKRALPKSRVSLTLWTMIALVIVVALIGLWT